MPPNRRVVLPSAWVNVTNSALPLAASSPTMRAPVALRSTIRAVRRPVHVAHRADTGISTAWRRASVSWKCEINLRKRSAVPARASVPSRALAMASAADAICRAI